MLGIFSFYPPFFFSLVFGNYVRIASTHYNDEEMRWEDGRAFTTEDFFAWTSGKFSTGDSYHVFPPALSLFFLVLNSLFYLLLMWYFDHIVSSNRGGNYRVYFCL